MRCADLAGPLLALLLVPFLAQVAGAGGINTDSALAVGQGVVLSRTQLRYADLETEVSRYIASQTLAYGATSRLTLFTSIARIWNRPGPDGFTDLALFGRYKLWARDARRQTLTFSGIGGITLPVGEAPFGGGDPGLLAGGVATWYRDVWQIDLDLIHNLRPDRDDLLRADVAIARSLRQAERWQLVAVIEANFSRSGKDDVLFLAPGLQLQLRGVVLEASFQIRVAEDAAAPVPDYVAVFSVRVIF